jgi:hypothetical protein
VPFELGRPLGVPGDAPFQTRVLTAVLKLLEAPSGPILVDYPEDAPPSGGPTVLACPVSFPQQVSDGSYLDNLRAAFMEEINHMHPWYDLSMRARTRTTAGVSVLEPHALAKFIGEFLEGNIPISPQEDIASAALLKLVVEDLKAFYFEAATAQPGQEKADSRTLSQWFWRETVAGKVLVAVREAHKDNEDEVLKRVVTRLLVPRVHNTVLASQDG